MSTYWYNYTQTANDTHLFKNDAAGRRVYDGSAKLFYDASGHVIQESTDLAEGNSVTEYVWAPDGKLILRDLDSDASGSTHGTNLPRGIDHSNVVGSRFTQEQFTDALFKFYKARYPGLEDNHLRSVLMRGLGSSRR